MRHRDKMQGRDGRERTHHPKTAMKTPRGFDKTAFDSACKTACGSTERSAAEMDSATEPQSTPPPKAPALF
jgi:hypothetical protein